MKNILLFAILFTISSCTKILYTHQQYMERFKTKDDVIHGFGIATEKRQENNISEWFYDYGRRTTAVSNGNSYTGVSVSGDYNSIYGNSNTNTGMITQIYNNENYVKFLFDSTNRVINWNTFGVDFGKKTIARGATMVAIGGTLLAVIAVTSAANAGN